jgi:hypothetical protein
VLREAFRHPIEARLPLTKTSGPTWSRNLPVALTQGIEHVEITMRYKLLGKSGLRVSELCLGTMTFGDVWRDWGLATSKEESKKIFEGFAAAGGNFIDTANK